jgi:WD40 repeat protein
MVRKIYWRQFNGTMKWVGAVMKACALTLTAARLVWASEKPLWIHPGHVGGISDSAFTTDFYLTAAFDGTIKAWNARTFEFSHTIVAHLRNPTWSKIAVSSDGKLVAHWSIRGVFICEVATGRLLAAIPIWDENAEVSFEAGSNLLVVTSGGERSFWDWTGQLEKKIAFEQTPVIEGPQNIWPAGYVNDWTYSPDGTEMAGVGPNNRLGQWRLPSGELIRSIVLPKASTWYSLYNSTVAYSPDGKYVAAGALVFDAKTGAVVKELLSKSQLPGVANNGVMTAVAWNSTVIAADDNGFAQIDYDSGQLVATFTNSGKRYFVPARVRLSPSVDLVMTEGSVFKLAGGETIRTFPQPVIAADRLWNLVVEQNLTNNCVARILRYEDGGVVATLMASESHLASAAAFSPDGMVVATAGGFRRDGMAADLQDPSVRLWRSADGALLKTFQQNGYGTKVVRFSPDGRYLACVANGYWIDVTVWNVESGETELSLRLTAAAHHADEVPAAIGMFGDKRWIAIADMRGVVVWDFARKRQVFRIDTETQGVTDLNVTPDGQRIVIGRSDGTVAMLSVPREGRFVTPEVNGTEGVVIVDLLGRSSYRFYHSVDLQTWTAVSGFMPTNDTYSAQFPMGERGYFRAVRAE